MSAWSLFASRFTAPSGRGMVLVAGLACGALLVVAAGPASAASKPVRSHPGLVPCVSVLPAVMHLTVPRSFPLRRPVGRCGGSVTLPVRCRIRVDAPVVSGTVLPCPDVAGLPGPCRVFVTAPPALRHFTSRSSAKAARPRTVVLPALRLNPCVVRVPQSPCDTYTRTSVGPGGRSGGTHVAGIRPRLICIGGFGRS